MLRCTECSNIVSMWQQQNKRTICSTCQDRVEQLAEAGERANNEALAKDALLKRVDHLEKALSTLEMRVNTMVANLNKERGLRGL